MQQKRDQNKHAEIITQGSSTFTEQFCKEYHGKFDNFFTTKCIKEVLNVNIFTITQQNVMENLSLGSFVMYKVRANVTNHLAYAV